MADSLFASLLNTIDSRATGQVAHALGQPEQSVSRGMESSIAALLGGLASKANDPNALGRILDTVPSSAGPVSWSQIASGAADPNSPLMMAGKRLLPALFGGGENTVTSSISRASGLSSGVISTLLTMAGPVVMSFISKFVRDSGMNMNSLGSLLQRESSTFRSALPAGLSDLFWPGTAATASASPVVAQAVQRERSSNWLLPAVVAAGLALGLLWLFSHARRPEHVSYVPTGEANRMAVPTPATTVCTIPSSANIPAGGVESRVLAFVQNPNAQPSNTTWFNTDELSFDTGSSRLKPASQAQLSNIATILNSCPAVRMTIAGYTDNVGAEPSNMRLSQNRANAVVAQLVDRGVPRDHLVAQGYGEQSPIASNDTAEGRAQNRRVAMCVTAK